MSPKQTTLKAGSCNLAAVLVVSIYSNKLQSLPYTSQNLLSYSSHRVTWLSLVKSPTFASLSHFPACPISFNGRSLWDYTLAGTEPPFTLLGSSDVPAKTHHCHQTRNIGLDTQTWAEYKSSFRQIVGIFEMSLHAAAPVFCCLMRGNPENKPEQSSAEFKHRDINIRRVAQREMDRRN